MKNKKKKKKNDGWSRGKQANALEEHGKQLVKYSDGKESLTLWKRKDFFEELTNRRMEETQALRKQTDFNNLTYRFRNESIPKKVLIGFKVSLGFYKNIKEGYITLEKEEEKQKVLKSEMNKIVKGIKKSEEQKTAIKKY